MQYTVPFPGGEVKYLHNTSFEAIKEVVDPAQCIIITENTVTAHYSSYFDRFKGVISIPGGEASKNLYTVQSVIQQLLDKEVHRKHIIIGVGGGLVTDITGMVASVYMRGLKFGFVPTTLLGMVDAATGGKNGVNFGLQKNLVGTINQPEFVLFDSNFLQTLPTEEWSNGFAEVIKYACLFDKKLFNELSEHNLAYYKENKAAVDSLVTKCVDWKNKIVLADERETGMRKLLNFGHTAGHAFETVCNIPHGQAVALGMLVACGLSEAYGLDKEVTRQLERILQQYDLPVSIHANTDMLMHVLAMDKKRNDNTIDFIVLKEVGSATIEAIVPEQIKNVIESFINAGSS